MDSKQLKQKRYAANCALLDTLKAIISDDSGEQRFSQILRNYGFVNQIGIDTYNEHGDFYCVWSDEFNLEPDILLERVKKESTKVF